MNCSGSFTNYDEFSCENPVISCRKFRSLFKINTSLWKLLWNTVSFLLDFLPQNQCINNSFSSSRQVSRCPNCCLVQALSSLKITTFHPAWSLEKLWCPRNLHSAILAGFSLGCQLIHLFSVFMERDLELLLDFLHPAPWFSAPKLPAISLAWWWISFHNLPMWHLFNVARNLLYARYHLGHERRCKKKYFCGQRITFIRVSS